MLNLLRRPAVTPAELDEGLRALGLDGTGHVIVHASLKSFGQLEGGARTVVDALERASATVVAPAFTYSTLLSRPTATAHARFHRDSRVSRDIGRVPQELVERADALRSFHPTLSFIALGQEARRITEAQSLSSPYQPIGALYDLDGFALLMGVDFGSNTSVHYGEHLAGLPLLTRYVPLDGQVVPTAFPNCSADFDNLAPEVHARARSVQVGQSTLRLYRVRDLVDSTVRLLNRDPEGLLCTYRGCRCQEVRTLVRQQGLRPRVHTGLIS
ncbi:aminoglycoside 3-N-acetyltransferase [Deinococcus grandis]|uniref:Aminoglycoside N(3)-acetyltransferase n=1 Tax=Deinococcus grandis TaxID=57498 RepID=A0A100HJY9_9DEIO|nr:AAC(3) family N-acetyltransferase [Deinococcus grandis]BBN94348.1 AAC(3) family N-acetyltransferase [Deinococcus grandis]GAQ22153.1 aminoglycoside 3-N-acetyltransferase [Deinococcus grandis]